MAATGSAAMQGTAAREGFSAAAIKKPYPPSEGP
jgi:hypothetical protein